jgi:hypothetical protein
MSELHSAEILAKIWIERWNDGSPDLIPLAENFVHTSPYGRVKGRQTYLDWVKPLAKKNVSELQIIRTLSRGNQAVIHFEMATPKGAIQVCDWISTENGQITEIHSFYDATDLR